MFCNVRNSHLSKAFVTKNLKLIVRNSHILSEFLATFQNVRNAPACSNLQTVMIWDWKTHSKLTEANRRLEKKQTNTSLTTTSIIRAKHAYDEELPILSSNMGKLLYNYTKFCQILIPKLQRYSFHVLVFICSYYVL